jgi:predicted alpha/beta-hydrolase family hydrolase
MLPVVILLASIAMASCRNPQMDAAIYQQLNEAADQFASVRNDLGYMQQRLDSLRMVIARQDTIIRKLAAIAGVPIPPGGAPD